MAAGIIVQAELESIPTTSILDYSINNATATAVLATETRQVLICGENIGIHSAIAIGSDGKAYKANNIYSNNKPTIAISFNAGTTGNTVKLFNQSEIVEVAGATFTIGKNIFLSDTGTFTTSISLSTGKIYQTLGTAISATQFIINIDSPSEIL